MTRTTTKNLARRVDDVSEIFTEARLQELESFCKDFGDIVRGIVEKYVPAEKRDQVLQEMTEALESRWGKAKPIIVGNGMSA